MKKGYKLSILAVIGSMMTLVGCSGGDNMNMQRQRPMPRDQMNRNQMQKRDSTMRQGATMYDDNGNGGGCAGYQRQNNGGSRYYNN